MKLTIALTIFCLMQVSATVYTQTNQFTLNVKNKQVLDVLKEIEKQSDYRFFYQDEQIDVNRNVSISITNKNFKQVIKELFSDQKVSYKIFENGVVLLTVNDFTKNQEITIKGKVTDTEGNPLPGVNVIEKGTTNGAVTNLEGEYNISVGSSKASLIFSYVGYLTEEVDANGKTIVNITLVEDIMALDEVVVIGYGTKLKSELTGSIAKLNSDKIKSRPVVGTLEALQGLISGVSITRQNGQPGRQSYDLKIRGASSINGNVPLILIDGVPGDINLINPNDIENLTVLKDAAAAIYGARAADGVILITTKRGKKSDKPMVSYSYNYALKNPSILKKPATTEHMVKMFNEANLNDGDSQTFSDETLAKIAANDPGTGPGENWGVESYPMFYQTTDWYGDLFKVSQRQTHNLSISGGTDKSTYLISAGYLKDDGTISVGDNYSDRYNLRLSMQTQLLDNLNFDANVSYDNQNIKAPSQLDDAINNALKAFSYIPKRNSAGTYYTYQGYQNPYQEIEKGGYSTTKNSRLNNNFKLDWEVVKGLTWTGQAAVNIQRYDNSAYYSTFHSYNWDNDQFGISRNSPNSANYSDWNSLYKNFSTYINYNKIFNKHSLALMAGASRESFDRNSKYMRGSDFSSNEIFVLTLSDPANLNTGDYWDNNSWALLSYFGRLNYSFGGKYYLDGTFRKDGSSKFSPDKRWSEIYPSVSVGWKISEESFFSSIVPESILNLAKVRASWGRTGNQDISSLGLFDYIQLISIGGQYPIDGATVSKMASLNGIASQDRTWETIETKNLGFDFSMLSSRLNLTFDLYQKENTNMLVSVAYPSTLGTGAPSTNAGELLTKGWDLTGNWNSNSGDFEYSIGFVLNYNTNELTNLQGQDTYNLGLTYAREGYPINSYFGYKGSIIRTQDQLDDYAANYAGKGIVPSTQPNGQKGLGVGDVMYEDIDGDGMITTYGDKTKGYTGDAVFLGSLDPKYTYSVTGSIKYKNFDFITILQGTGDKYTWRGNGNFGVPYAYPWFQPLDYFYGKTFFENNSDAQYPRLSNNGTVKRNNYQCSDIYLENTRYLRLKNITLGYTFPENNLINKLTVSNLRIYVSGQDIFEFAKGTWDKTYDPEENSAEYNYPMYRTFSFGASVNF